MSEPWPLRDSAEHGGDWPDEQHGGDVSPAAGCRRQPRAGPRRLGRVLIVDDSWDAREMYAAYFRALDYDAATAEDGRAAIQLAMELRPDVIVMDLAMPGMNGISAAHHLKHHPRTRRTPIILLTGHSARAIADGALESGIDVFLTKPCLPEDLASHVRQLLQQRRTGQ